MVFSFLFVLICKIKNIFVKILGKIQSDDTNNKNYFDNLENIKEDNILDNQQTK